MPIDELAKWLDEHLMFDDAPHMQWFVENYCDKCESIMCKYEDSEKVLGFKPFYDAEVECTYCEIYKKCRFFPNMDEVPDGKETVKLWLESEIE